MNNKQISATATQRILTRACAVAVALLCLAARGSCADAPQRCCADNGVMTPDGVCPNTTSRVTLAACKHGHFLLSEVIVDEGRLTTRDTKGYYFAMDPSEFCVGLKRNSTDPNDTLIVTAAILCYQGEEQSSIEIFGILTITSAVFLILTIAVYLYLPEMRDLQGKCIVCLCACMALGFLNLGITQLGYHYENAICSLQGFMIYFWLMATFFWMNVVSINVFRSVRVTSHRRDSESKEFLYYSFYAWGFAFLFLIILLCANYVDGEHIYPGIGVYNCWFQGPKETWTYFYGPVAILITANITLFVLTSIRLWRTNKNHEVSNLKRLRYKFLLHLKLFVVMGLSWVFEIASFADAKSRLIWKISDVFNCLQGVMFFVLLVALRRRALRGLADRGVGGPCGRRLAQRLDSAEDEAAEGFIDADDAGEAADVSAPPCRADRDDAAPDQRNSRDPGTKAKGLSDDRI